MIMMPEGEETSGERPPREIERDLLAERRARRELGDPLLTRRAEAAEATVRTLEAHLASLERRLQESNEEREELTRELAGRELEVRRVKQREHAEQQLRVEAEDQRERTLRETRAQIDQMRRQLTATERQAGELARELERVRHELSEVQQAMALSDPLKDWSEGMHERLTALERRTEQAARELASERAARERADRELVRLRERDERLVAIVRELVLTSGELRLDFQRELSALGEELRQEALAEDEAQLRGLTGLGAQIDAMSEELARAVDALREQAARRSPASPEQSELTQRLQAPTDAEELRRQEMAQALAAAVERLRARVAEVGEDEQQEGLAPAAQKGVALSWEPLRVPSKRPSWLAPAIRRLAESDGPEQAGALILALIPAQRLLVDRSLRYELLLEELGTFLVELEPESAQVRKVDQGLSAGKVDFRLQGGVADFAELAAGGAGRRLTRVRVRGHKRVAKRLLKALRRPLALADLVQAGVAPPPLLLLQALGEAIDESWFDGNCFTLAYRLEGEPEGEQAVRLRIAQNAPIEVSVVTLAELEEERPDAIVDLDRRALLCSLAGIEAPEQEPPTVLGDVEAVRKLTPLAARAQGLEAQGA